MIVFSRERVAMSKDNDAPYASSPHLAVVATENLAGFRKAEREGCGLKTVKHNKMKCLSVCGRSYRSCQANKIPQTGHVV